MTEQTALVAFTEENAKAALIQARGDIFVASQMLGVTALRLDRAVRLSEALRTTLFHILEVRHENADFEKITAERLEADIAHRLSIYRVAGLDALHDLATMPIDSNSAQNQVKLAAAARLAGGLESNGAGGDVADTLRALNAEYHATAPRIRVVRERLTVEVSGANESRVIDAASDGETRREA